MGKTAYKWKDHVRFGHLPVEERKAIDRVFDKEALKDSNSGSAMVMSACGEQVHNLVECLEANGWSTENCEPQMHALDACENKYKKDPDPTQVVSKWQRTIRHRVYMHFVKQKILPRLK